MHTVLQICQTSDSHDSIWQAIVYQATSLVHWYLTPHCRLAISTLIADRQSKRFCNRLKISSILAQWQWHMSKWQQDTQYPQTKQCWHCNYVVLLSRNPQLQTDPYHHYSWIKTSRGIVILDCSCKVQLWHQWYTKQCWLSDICMTSGYVITLSAIGRCKWWNNILAISVESGCIQNSLQFFKDCTRVILRPLFGIHNK